MLVFTYLEPVFGELESTGGTLPVSERGRGSSARSHASRSIARERTVAFSQVLLPRTQAIRSTSVGSTLQGSVYTRTAGTRKD